VLAATALGVGATQADAMTPPQTTESGVVTLLAGGSTGSIASFWATTMRSWGNAYSKPPITYYHTSTVGLINTPCGKALLNNSFYCSTDNRIYLDYTWNQGLVSSYGDFGGGGILAHEWGHAIQAWLRYGVGGYRREYHADCLAGMYVRYGYSTGRLNGSDYGEFYNWLYYQPYTIDHGRGTARAAWYQYGYTQYSLAACNQAYSLPVTPAVATAARTATAGIRATNVTGTASGPAYTGVRRTPPPPPVQIRRLSADGPVPLPRLAGPVPGHLPASMH
jgi:hypothetical protein